MEFLRNVSVLRTYAKFRKTKPTDSQAPIYDYGNGIITEQRAQQRFFVSEDNYFVY